MFLLCQKRGKVMKIIECKEVSKWYGSTEKPVYALKKASFEIYKGEFVVILGPSGAGKSTLLNILGGIDTLDEGSVLVDKECLNNKKETELAKYRASKVGFVFQFYNLIPTLTVLENVALMKEVKKDILNPQEVLERVGLKEHMHKFPSQLSGGEQQRVSIARAVCKKPVILLCDEPTGALDSITGCMVLELLYDMCKNYGMTTIVVTHNANMKAIANRIINVKNGEIIDVIENKNPMLIKDVEW